MTPELIALARKAMSLRGAPDHYDFDRIPYYPTPEGVVWFIALDRPAGWALGGLLLGALGLEAHQIRPEVAYIDEGLTTQMRRIFLVGVDPDVNGSDGVECATLAEACCRVAVSLGRWPGGVN